MVAAWLHDIGKGERKQKLFYKSAFFLFFFFLSLLTDEAIADVFVVVVVDGDAVDCFKAGLM